MCIQTFRGWWWTRDEDDDYDDDDDDVWEKNVYERGDERGQGA